MAAAGCAPHSAPAGSAEPADPPPAGTSEASQTAPRPDLPGAPPARPPGPGPPPGPDGSSWFPALPPHSWLPGAWWWLITAVWAWCGPFCQKAGSAVLAAGHLAIAAATIAAVYGLILVWTCLVMPILRIFWTAVLYLLGRGTWRDVSRAEGRVTEPPNWCGPASPRAWSSQYVQQEVRARDMDQRQPYDLLIRCEGGYARLSHGPVKGRTNRHGFVCAFDEVIGCTSRSLRRKLEEEPRQVHLCASEPCTADPSVCEVHVTSSASVLREASHDLRDMAGRGAWCRLWHLASWAWQRCTTGVAQIGRCTQRRRRQGRTVLDPNSETDTDTEDRRCQASLVALALPQGARALSECPCPDSARGDPIALLVEDARKSAASELDGDGTRLPFAGCPQQRNAYLASRASRACAQAGCNRSRKYVRAGIALCDEHAKSPVTWHDETDQSARPSPGSPPPGPESPRASRPSTPRVELVAPASPRAWLRWGDATVPHDRAYYSFHYAVTPTLASGGSGPSRSTVHLPDLGVHFSVPSDLTMGGLNSQQADQLARSRAPLKVDPPWTGEDGHNVRGERLPWSAMLSVARGDYPQGYALHHMARVVDPGEQPQNHSPLEEAAVDPPVTPRRRSPAPVAWSEPDAAAGDQNAPAPDEPVNLEK